MLKQSKLMLIMFNKIKDLPEKLINLYFWCGASYYLWLQNIIDCADSKRLEAVYKQMLEDISNDKRN